MRTAGNKPDKDAQRPSDLGPSPKTAQGQDIVWRTHDPFKRVTGAALRRLNKRQNVAATVEDALL